MFSRPLHISILGPGAILLDDIVGLAGESWSPIGTPGFSKILTEVFATRFGFLFGSGWVLCQFPWIPFRSLMEKHGPLLDSSDSQNVL